MDQTAQDPWVDIAALENETAQLLQFVSPQKNVGRNQKRDGRGSQDTTASKRGADSKKRPKADDSATPTKRPLKKGRGVGGGAGDTPNRVTALMALSQSTDSGLDRTKSLYNAGGGSSNSTTATPTRSAMGSSGSSRVTVEVLDDAGQDATPRDDVELKREKLRDQLLAAEAEQVRLTQASEAGYRTSHFPQEKNRVARRDDTFVPAPTVRIGDVNREKSRLDRLEESARAKARASRNEADSRREFLQQDVAATKIQSLFRSAIGRQKFDLVKRLKELVRTFTQIYALSSTIYTPIYTYTPYHIYALFVHCLGTHPLVYVPFRIHALSYACPFLYPHPLISTPSHFHALSYVGRDGVGLDRGARPRVRGHLVLQQAHRSEPVGEARRARRATIQVRQRQETAALLLGSCAPRYHTTTHPPPALIMPADITPCILLLRLLLRGLRCY